MLLRPGRADVLLALLRRLSVSGHRPLLDQRLLDLAAVLIGGGDQGSVDDLNAAHGALPCLSNFAETPLAPV